MLVVLVVEVVEVVEVVGWPVASVGEVVVVGCEVGESGGACAREGVVAERVGVFSWLACCCCCCCCATRACVGVCVRRDVFQWS